MLCVDMSARKCEQDTIQVEAVKKGNLEESFYALLRLNRR
jgi:hypothetical protein